ncbi:hypothetical protein HNP84_006680 [Thermocatellispora tengchongensis]|uniref:Tetratricopeptide repeat protein n=1 Tax=Thermocatellispora tengchongensis TaxID=1073253 RepID=A0A840PBA6_9ACTN|nr:hypothetical protein [Thermocatellispora tengchongensis]MBB5136928.1 hypothetical protein [Thermocatellispora tengchongensis]
MFGRRRKSQQLLQRAIDSYRRHETPDSVGPTTGSVEPYGEIPRVFGTTPPSMLSGGRLGDLDLQMDLLRDMVRLLGTHHPVTLITQANLFVLSARVGDHDPALSMLPGIAEEVAGLLGPGHAGVLVMRRDLAHLQWQFGDAETGIISLDRVVADMIAKLGPDHPDTLMAMEARLMAQMRIEPWIERSRENTRAVADAMYRLGGPVEMTEHDFSELESRIVPPAEMVVRCEKVVRSCTEGLGPDHPVTLSARHTLNSWRRQLGDPQVRAAEEDLHAHQLRVLGPGHPDTFVVRATLLRGSDPPLSETALFAAYTEYFNDALRALGPAYPMTRAAHTEVMRLAGHAL